MNELEFKRISHGSSFLGSDKGGWIYASQRPRYEVQLPDYYILEEPITRKQVAGLLGEDDEIEDCTEPMVGLIGSEIEAIRKQIEEQLDFESLSGEWEIRPPSYPEWHHAQNEIRLAPGVVEILGDAAAANHRGAMMDGRIRPIETTGPLQYHRLAVEMHPKRKGVFATSNIPVDYRAQAEQILKDLAVMGIKHNDAVKRSMVMKRDAAGGYSYGIAPRQAPILALRRQLGQALARLKARAGARDASLRQTYPHVGRPGRLLRRGRRDRLRRHQPAQGRHPHARRAWQRVLEKR